MTSSHIMIDEETLSTRKNAVVVTLGAVMFDTDGWLGSTFHKGLDIDEQLAAGRTVDASTIKWWLEQASPAQRGIVDRISIARPVGAVLDAFDEFVGRRPNTKIWCKGANFDIALLDSLYEHAGRKRPYAYNALGDTRSFAAFFTPEDDPEQGLQHDALSDAVWQARQLQNLCRRMGWTNL